jgi:hypothetical protein
VQQGAFEHAALIWTRSSNTIRARGMYVAAHEAGYMSAPDDAPKSALKIPLAQGAVIHVAQIVRDSLCDSEVLVGLHEQTYIPDLSHNELAFLQFCPEAAWFAADLV